MSTEIQKRLFSLKIFLFIKYIALLSKDLYKDESVTLMATV